MEIVVFSIYFCIEWKGDALGSDLFGGFWFVRVNLEWECHMPCFLFVIFIYFLKFVWPVFPNWFILSWFELKVFFCIAEFRKRLMKHYHNAPLLKTIVQNCLWLLYPSYKPLPLYLRASFLDYEFQKTALQQHTVLMNIDTFWYCHFYWCTF